MIEWIWAPALALGFLVAWIVQSVRLSGRSRQAASQRGELEAQLAEQSRERARLEERSRSQEQALAEARRELSQSRDENTSLHRKLAGADERIRSMDTRVQEQKEELAQLQKRLTAEFETLATRVLDANSEKFVVRNRESIDKLLTPLTEKIASFRERVDATHDQSVKDRAQLVAQMKALGELNQRMSEEARNLTTALKGQVKTQGTWGELILSTVLEKSGLVEGQEYSAQRSLTAQDGKRLQPDVLVNLPEGKHLVIDSKVSLVAYERCVNAQDKGDQDVALREHVHSIRSHVQGLSEKRYDALYEIQSPDFVLMFIPIEPAFAVAMQSDDTIFDFAFRKNVVLVTPSTLLATLRTVANIWRQEKQTRNAIDIADRSGALYDKFVGFFEDMQRIGDAIGRTQREYNSAMNKLKTGRGNLVNQVQTLKDLGAKAKRSLPEETIEDAVLDQRTLP
ncbi:DNA recombination protein RmuC [Pelagicoccus sp. SDUM812003]|uniref:DNA recombination protein RmuC n=1 Tax=Pelagicoccus sp. SDUM812003 TaxID=3041267 RepID=UPI00281029A7|nr:DNA recombination protein RmuC [Pelagicoccus sp. SDUM812003]MDQ8205204.1 DNA recombination protein RmuC [Pelagicoccus sp. SDUM812003]